MAARSEYPRLLFLTPAAFNRISGGGITFGNLFRGWPKDRLATVHNDPVPTDDDVCDQYYVLSRQEIHRWGPVDHLVPSPDADTVDRQRIGSASRGGPHPLLAIGKRVIFGNMLPDAGSLTLELEAWVEKFRPQVLYTILGSNAMMDLALALRSRFDLPLVFHVMDDWLATAYRGGIFAPLARRRMERLFASVVEQASSRLGICDEMCVAYERRYGRSFEPFQNAVDVRRWVEGAREGGATSARRELLYVGSILHFAQLESLVDCCDAVLRLAELGERVHLSIHSPARDLARHGARLPVSPHITVSDTIRDDAALFARLQDADVLLLPVNFDPGSVRFIRYSMPTKIPAYLASGTPILAYGPDSVAQVHYATESGWALVVHRREPGALLQGIRDVLSDSALRARVSRNAVDCALRYHDIAAIRPRFQELLANAAR